MVLTILEAHVDPQNVAALQAAFTDGIRMLDPGITQTFLVNSGSDPALWRILTFWASREALDQMRDSDETPRGLLMFRAAGAQPTLSIFDVSAHASA